MQIATFMMVKWHEKSAGFDASFTTVVEQFLKVIEDLHYTIYLYKAHPH